MSIIIVLIGISLFVAIIFLLAFAWAVKSGQYNDIYTPSVRVLFDNKKEISKENSKETINAD